jgi:hypothetical protein
VLELAMEVSRGIGALDWLIFILVQVRELVMELDRVIGALD